jgi:hypothetical protein
MTADSNAHCCAAMTQHVLDDDIPLVYVGKFREYGIRILDGGTSYSLIDVCPWCGRKLPVSLRNAWFEQIEKLGVEPESAGVPESFASDQWWKELQLP